MCLLVIWMSAGKMSIRVFCPLFNQVACFGFLFLLNVAGAAYIFWILTLYQSNHLQIFSPFWLSPYSRQCALLGKSMYVRRRQWHPTPALLPGKSHGWRSLVGCSPWGLEESDTTERLHFHFSLSCIGEGNGNPFQCSCLENPRDRGAWWAAVYGVTQSRTQLKRLSSSSSSMQV